MKDQNIKLTVNLLVGLAIAVITIWVGWSEGDRWSLLLCDGSFTAAVMLLGVGGLQHFANQGLFRAMSYGIKLTWETFFPMAGSHRGEDYAAFRERKESNQKSPKAMLIAGLIYLIISLVLLAVYYLFPGI